MLNYWENKLRTETLHLSSLKFFDTTRLSLSQPSLLWLAAGSNSFESAKSLIIGKMISGRYRSDYLCRHWTPSNRNGFCLAQTCPGIVGDLVHMLTLCPSLQPTRTRLVSFWQEKTAGTPILHNIISKIIHSPPDVQVQFILDPCSSPQVLVVWGLLTQEHLLHLLYLVRTFAYYMHRAKMIALGRWPGDPGRKQKLPSENVVMTAKQDINFSVTGTEAPPLTWTDPTRNTSISQASASTKISRTKQLFVRQFHELSDSASLNTTTPHRGLCARSGAAARVNSDNNHHPATNDGTRTLSSGVVAGECIGGQ